MKEVSQEILHNLIIYTQCGTYVYIYRYMHKSKYSTTVYMYVLTLCKRGIFASMKIRFVGSEQNDILYFSRGNVYTQELRCIKIMKLTKHGLLWSPCIALHGTKENLEQEILKIHYTVYTCTYCNTTACICIHTHNLILGSTIYSL